MGPTAISQFFLITGLKTYAKIPPATERNLPTLPAHISAPPLRHVYYGGSIGATQHYVYSTALTGPFCSLSDSHTSEELYGGLGRAQAPADCAGVESLTDGSDGDRLDPHPHRSTHNPPAHSP